MTEQLNSFTVKSWQVECANDRLKKLKKEFSKINAYHVIVKRGEASTTLVVWESHLSYANFYEFLMNFAMSADERNASQRHVTGNYTKEVTS